MRTLLLLLLVLYPGIALHAQSTEAAIKDRLLHKPLYLRGLWMESKLAFDADGKPTGKVTPFPFTLSGIDIEKVKLGSGKLEIEGKRVGLEFEKDTPKRVGLSDKIHLQIARPPSGDYGAALDAVFAPEVADLVPNLPSYWEVLRRASPPAQRGT